MAPSDPHLPFWAAELILFAWSVSLNSFKYASPGPGDRTLMLQKQKPLLQGVGGEGDTGHKGVVQRHETHPLFKTKRSKPNESHTHKKKKNKTLATPQNQAPCAVIRNSPKAGSCGVGSLLHEEQRWRDPLPGDHSHLPAGNEASGGWLEWFWSGAQRAWGARGRV